MKIFNFKVHPASRMVKYLKDNKLGRATFYPLDTIKARYVEYDIIEKIKEMDGYINRLDKVLEYNEKYSNIIQYVIKKIL